MKTFKTIMTIAGLLAIGFTAGFFTHRYAVQQRIENVAKMRFAAGFENHLFRVIEADSQQREELRPIVNEYAQRIAEEFRDHNKKRRSIIDSMNQEIRPLLTEAQLEKLENFHRRFRPNGPPPDRRKRNRREKTGR